MSFFLVRLLQSFSEFSLALDAQPEDSKPPASWKTAPGTKGTDKIKIALSLTMSVKVVPLAAVCHLLSSDLFVAAGRPLG